MTGVEPSVFKGVKINDLTVILENNLGGMGRMIGGSKTTYRLLHPDSIVYFNACIFDELLTQVWWGDIDLTEDAKTLDKIAKIYGEPFYVTPEMYRSDFEKFSYDDIKSNPLVIKFNERVREKNNE